MAHRKNPQRRGREVGSMTKSHFHPDHIADLHKSGLNETMIDLMGARSVPPAEIGRLLGI
jgi:hypothetical protein